MSLQGFRCPATVPTVGEEHTPEFCVRDCPHQCLPTGVLWTIWQLNAKNPHVGDMVSPTSLPRCARKLKLTRTEDYYEEPTKMYDATRGSLYHGFLEDRGLVGVKTEQRIYKVVERGPQSPWVISGCMDFYDEKRRRLEDYKTMADKWITYFYNDGAKPDHVMQLNVYRWLMSGGHIAPAGCDPLVQPTVEEVRAWPTIDWPVDELQLHYMLMNRCISTGKKSIEYLVQKGEPNRGKPFKFEIDRKWIKKHGYTMDGYEITLEFPTVKVLPFKKVEEHLIETGPTLVRAFREPDFMPAGVLHDNDSNWECRFCPVTARCAEIEQQIAELRFFGSEEPPVDPQQDLLADAA